MADKKESEGEATKRFPEIRKDAVHNRWVIFSPARSRRPSDFKSKSSIPTPTDPKSDNCPFCFGNEHLCAPEIFRLQPDSAHWKIRVIQNLYPALSREGDLLPPLQPHYEGQDREEVDDVRKYCSGNRRMMGFGFHDVVIESPLHSAQLVDLPAFEVGDVLLAYKRRIEQLRTYDTIQYIQTGKCTLCEVRADELLIDESAHFISIVPFAATFPFEVWIIPRAHSSHFHDLDDKKAVDLGGVLKLMLAKISLQLNNPPFNFMIHTSPFHFNPSCEPYTHWFLQIIPQLTIVGGFEAATGCYINPIFPEDAAKVLREVQLPS